MAFTDVAQPLHLVTADERVDYLKRVLLWTAGGLFLSGTTGFMTAGALFVAQAIGMNFLFNSMVMMVIIFGAYGVAQFLAPKMVFGNAKVPGFLIGSTFQGIAMGYLLLAAVLMGMSTGNPFGLVMSALVLTSLTGVGLTAYVWTKPREFGMLRAALSALFIPMMVLMVVSFVVPSLFGGTLGVLMAALFVVISAAGLLYQVNQVLHKLRTDQHIEGAFLITMGLLILYWNILSLLMRLNRR